jgi:hypothetical protein
MLSQIKLHRYGTGMIRCLCPPCIVATREGLDHLSLQVWLRTIN